MTGIQVARMFVSTLDVLCGLSVSLAGLVAFFRLGRRALEEL